MTSNRSAKTVMLQGKKKKKKGWEMMKKKEKISSMNKSCDAEGKESECQSEVLYGFITILSLS